MQIRIKFQKEVDGKKKNFSRTFSKVNDDAKDEKILAFAKAFMSLSPIKDYTIEKINKKEVQQVENI